MTRVTVLLALAVVVTGCAAPPAAPPARTTQIGGAAPTPAPTVSPGPTVTATTAPSQPESEIWARLRGELPSGTPVAVPRWLPSSIDRRNVQLRELISDTREPRYLVRYADSTGAELLFGLGPAPALSGQTSGVGTRVRGVSAVLNFSATLWNDRTAPAPRRLQWTEGRHVLRVESDRFSGDDLLHVGWYLDPAGQPPPLHKYTRVKTGACAKLSAPPEETVRNLLALTGGGDVDATSDCLAMERIAEYGNVGGWAELPRTSNLSFGAIEEFAGRVVVMASWTFASDPGGAWGLSATRFFLLGPEDGRWRIFEVWSGGPGRLP